MYFEKIIIILLFIVFIVVIFAECDVQKRKEIEIIKNTHEYVIYQNCHNLDGKWYCYNE